MKTQLIECPRDAMQGIKPFIDTEVKAAYLNVLLQVGFHTLDFGSFVSPKAIPQLRDTSEVLGKLDLNNTTTKLLSIVANARGANDAAKYDEITYLGYPFSVSETFQQRNTNASIDESLQRVEDIQSICKKHGKTLVVYLSMGFGNPYGDAWSPDIVTGWGNRLVEELEVDVLSLSDTIGVSNRHNIEELFTTMIPALPKTEIGAHLHTNPSTWKEKVDAAYASGCRRFDGALKGFGGCPMADDELVGNMDTLNLLSYIESKEELLINHKALEEAILMLPKVFP